ncbi:hypothetical protein MARPO_0085s0046 [Marchantia polymorpha]|uniref:Uncharacterized protein n=1 Tax=Marchantia polymorpha TaxID=3197 RepID=A0A2R6WJ20_MARPO|nr:hypothetical protein MARPO_0085s0046 [Marchantia polymorpha]|eukprot:PTQ33833.1 hypothetical protein MARPO_0085s0046 [Marchantia polymorpha]
MIAHSTPPPPPPQFRCERPFEPGDLRTSAPPLPRNPLHELFLSLARSLAGSYRPTGPHSPPPGPQSVLCSAQTHPDSDCVRSVQSSPLSVNGKYGVRSTVTAGECGGVGVMLLAGLAVVVGMVEA